MRRLALLLMLACCVLVPVRAAGAADAALTRSLTDMLADTGDIERALAQLRHFRDAGFIYQPQLSVSALDVSPKGRSADSRAVLSGMMGADLSCAFFFGGVDDVVREQRAQAAMQKGLAASDPPALDRGAIAALQAGTHTQEGRLKLAGHTSSALRALLPKAAADDASLRLLGAHLYGTWVERLYVSAIMGLAALEEGTADALRQVDPRAYRRLVEILEMLGGRRLLGPAVQSDRRLALVRRLQAMAEDGLDADETAQIVDACDDERERILAGDRP